MYRIFAAPPRTAKPEPSKCTAGPRNIVTQLGFVAARPHDLCLQAQGTYCLLSLVCSYLSTIYRFLK